MTIQTRIPRDNKYPAKASKEEVAEARRTVTLTIKSRKTISTKGQKVHIR